MPFSPCKYVSSSSSVSKGFIREYFPACLAPNPLDMNSDVLIFLEEIPGIASWKKKVYIKKQNPGNCPGFYFCRVCE